MSGPHAEHPPPRRAGAAPSYALAAISAGSTKPLGTVTYSTAKGSLFGDVNCARGGRAQMTATANDQQLQNVTVIPLNVATPMPSTTPGAKPVLTTLSGLPPGG